MQRTQCVLTLLTLYAGVVQSFSWDIVISRDNRLEFYNEGTLTYTATPTHNNIHWITYDPFHNRVLFRETVATKSVKPIFGYDIATNKTQTLMNLKQYTWSLVYDPARERLFASIVLKGKQSIHSFLVKPGSDAEAEGNTVINLRFPANDLAVDSCRGYIYWAADHKCKLEKVRFNESEIIFINDVCNDTIKKTALTIDPQTQKIYWAEKPNNITEFFNADLDGNNKKSLYKKKMEVPTQISVSKDFIYWVDTNNKPYFWQLPKNTSSDTDVTPKLFALNNASTNSLATAIASNYAIEEQTRGNPDCKALKNLLLAKPESGVSGDTRNISVCHNYCLEGNCSANAGGTPGCRCNVGYSGKRCEINMCLEYCLHKGVCSLNGKNQPVCRCSEGYEGDRCDVSVFLRKFFQQFVKITTSMLNEVLKDGVSSDCKGVKSTCVSTVT